MSRSLLACFALTLAPGVALGATCDVHAKKATSAKGDALVSAYRDLVQCDTKQAEAAYDAFMKASGDVDTLVGLSITAIDAKLYTPVWSMLDKIPDYDQRDQVAQGIGALCTSHNEVVPFVQGAYFGLRAIQFGAWDEALASCESPVLLQWLESTTAKPPASAFDDKYKTVVEGYLRRRGPEALPVLEKAAIEASKNGGPFDTLVEKMDAAMQPTEIGESITPENQKKLETALVSVANSVGPQQAAIVADRLFTLGAESAAASLLPRVYPDRVQPNGHLLYGVAAIEVCEKEATVHWASVHEPAKRWSVAKDAEAAATTFKPKSKCTEGAPWTVVVTGEPLADTEALHTWVAEVVGQWAAKGLDAKEKEEKAVELP